jgi:FHA domain
VGDDFDDTVVVPARHDVVPTGVDTDDTIIAAEGISVGPADTTGTDVGDSIQTVGLYAFRIGLGSEPILLDAPCFVGRRPSAPRIPSRHPPRLVRVPSVLKEVSATHLEVRQVGSSVVVTDLRSTNGSLVMMPGSVPRKLRQGESVVVTPGTLVDIGDENIIQILPMQRPV